MAILKILRSCSLLFLFILFSFWGQAQEVTTIEGYAKDYVGKEIRIYKIEDYVSRVKEEIASAKVQPDSTFHLSFTNHKTRKLRVEVGENFFYIYTEPKANYNLFIEGGSPYFGENATNVTSAFYFLNLDTNDINYKILAYKDRQMDFLQSNYSLPSLRSPKFMKELDTFKREMATIYKRDTNSFFRTYIRYSIALLDNIPYTGQRNSYEKYDFYIKNSPVRYQNDRYMDYILHYYEKYAPQLPKKAFLQWKEGILNSSPSLIMNALGMDYKLGNVRVRELVMIKMLSEVYFTKRFPKDNIITILDSVAEYALFPTHKKIASNIRFRLLDLTPGSVVPDFTITVNGEKKNLKDYKGKHVYFQFVKKDNKRSMDDLRLLYPIQQEYAKYVDFVTILVVDKEDSLLQNPLPFIKKYNIGWDIAVISKDNKMLKKFNVSNYPHYLLMDATSNVVASPALTPRPNNEYHTIEFVLSGIKKTYEAIQKRKDKDRGYLQKE